MLIHWFPAQYILVSCSYLQVFPFSTDRKDEFIYLLWKELDFLGVKEELTRFLH